MNRKINVQFPLNVYSGRTITEALSKTLLRWMGQFFIKKNFTKYNAQIFTLFYMQQAICTWIQLFSCCVFYRWNNLMRLTLKGIGECSNSTGNSINFQLLNNFFFLTIFNLFKIEETDINKINVKLSFLQTYPFDPIMVIS